MQLYWAQVDTNRAYYGTDARVYQLFAGALLAVALHTWTPRPLRGPAPTSSRWPAWPVCCCSAAGWSRSHRPCAGMGATLVSVMLIAGLVLGDQQPLSRLLARPVPVFLGRISYGTYLWHWPVIVALTTLFDTSPAIIAIFALAIGTGLAALSYEVLEMPIRKSKLLNRFTWTVAIAGVAASALVAVAVVPTMLEDDRKPAINSELTGPAGGTGLAGDKASEPIPDGIDFEEARASTGNQHWCAVDDPQACVVRKGDGPHVLFIGDSQAMSLTPMFEKLAEEHDLTLSFNVYAGCPWQEGLQNAKIRARPRSPASRPGSAGTTTRCASSTRTWSCCSTAPATTRRSGARWSPAATAGTSPWSRRCSRRPTRPWRRSTPWPAGPSSSSGW